MQYKIQKVSIDSQICRILDFQSMKYQSCGLEVWMCSVLFYLEFISLKATPSMDCLYDIKAIIFYKSHFENPLKNSTSYVVEAGFWEVSFLKNPLKNPLLRNKKWDL